MDRNLTYIVPLAVLSLVGGAVQAWNTLHTRPSTSPGRTEGSAAEGRTTEGRRNGPPILVPAAVQVHGPEPKGEGDELWLRPIQRLLQGQRDRLRQLLEQRRADRRALEQGVAQEERLREQMAEREETARELRRQVALLEAVIQAWEDAAPAATSAVSPDSAVPPAAAVPQPVPTDPARSSVWEEAGRRFALQGSYRQAGEAFCRALWLNPADPVLHYNLGLLSEEVLGEPGRALYHYGRFLRLAPEDPKAPTVRGRVQGLTEEN